MEYDLARIYESLTRGGNLADAKPGVPVEIRGTIDGFHTPAGGKISFLSRKIRGIERPELKIEYGDVVIEVGEKYICLSKVPESMEPLFRFLDDNVIGEFDE